MLEQTKLGHDFVSHSNLYNFNTSYNVYHQYIYNDVVNARGVDEFASMSGYLDSHSECVLAYRISFNLQASFDGRYIIFIPKNSVVSHGYFWLQMLDNGSVMYITPCINLPSGVLEVVETLIMSPLNMIPISIPDMTPRAARDDFLWDCHIRKQFNLTLDEYITDIIDYLIAAQDVIMDNGKHTFTAPDHSHDSSSAPPQMHGDVEQYDTDVVVDIYFPKKQFGHMTLQSFNFEFIGPSRAPVHLDSVDKLCQVASVIKSTGVPNYKGARIPLHTPLNIPHWDFYLQDYPDKRLCHYLRFGFPLGLEGSAGAKLCNTHIKNHSSAIQYPEAVNTFIKDELAEGAMLGPFSSPPRGLHCSPMLTREKDGGKRRVVLDLSFPRGTSVNDFAHSGCYDNVAYKLKFPSTDDICNAVMQCSDPYISKIDISRAFRHMHIDPLDAIKLGIHWEGAYYVDIRCAFGFLHGSGMYQLISDLLRHIMAQRGFTMFPYLDDYVIVSEREDSLVAFHYLRKVLSELNLPINPKKICPPGKVMTCLGIDFDLVSFSLAIAQDKIVEICTLIEEVMNKKALTRTKFQSLTGKLLYIHRCVKPARIFINRTLALFRQNKGKKRIYLTSDFYADMQWFMAFLEKFNGTTIFKKAFLDFNEVYIDACLEVSGEFGIAEYTHPQFLPLLKLTTSHTSKC